MKAKAADIYAIEVTIHQSVNNYPISEVIWHPVVFDSVMPNGRVTDQDDLESLIFVVNHKPMFVRPLTNND